MSTPSAPTPESAAMGSESIQDTAREKMQQIKQTATDAMQSARQHIPRIGHQNVAEPERLGSLVAGALLTVIGMRRGGITGMLAAFGGAALLSRGATGHCSMYSALGINTAGPTARNASLVGNDAICVEKTIIVNKPAEELYRFWRNFENLPRIMQHLESVTIRDGKHSHWVAKGPAGMSVEWDAEIINERENELIAWRSLEPADVDSAGSVRFNADKLGRGTWVKVSLMYSPPAGKVGAAIAKLFGEEPHQQIEEDLRRFKAFMETGEIPTTEGQASCRSAGI